MAYAPFSSWGGLAYGLYVLYLTTVQKQRYHCLLYPLWQRIASRTLQNGKNTREKKTIQMENTQRRGKKSKAARKKAWWQNNVVLLHRCVKISTKNRQLSCLWLNCLFYWSLLSLFSRKDRVYLFANIFGS